MKASGFSFFGFLCITWMIGTAGFAQKATTRADQDYKSNPRWIKMMDDPDANFFEIQKAFYTYWEGRTTHRGDGYKPFKRWEYYWQSRVNPDGSFPKSDYVYNEFNRYKQDHPISDRLKSGQAVWQEMGPKTRVDLGGYTGVGRVNAIAFHPADTATVYVGAPSGGFWITHDGGKHWAVTTDSMPTIGVSSILVDKNNPNLILIGTGDRDGGNSAGLGVFRSDDGGSSWVQFNSGMGNVTVGMMTRSDANERLILAATSGGVFKSLDGGENWTRTSPNQSHYKDVKFQPGSGTVAYATADGDFYRSVDGGDSWALVPNSAGYPSGGRLVIGITPANPNLVYLIDGAAGFDGCFQSVDMGQTFTTQSTTPNILGWEHDGTDASSQAWYDLMVQVDATDPQILYVGGINIWKSTDGGKTWGIITHWWGDRTSEVHADQHTFALNPLNNRLYAGNDGGIYCTDNKGTTWKEISEGLGIGQMYKLGVSNTDANKLICGFQDNGSATWLGDRWIDTGGGDGMECAVDPFDSRYSYSTYVAGVTTRFYNNGNSRTVAGKDVYGITEEGAWVAPFLISEGDGNTMVFGFKNVWICRNIKTAGNPVWTKISDNLAGSNSENMSCLEQSPADLNLLYAVRSDNKVFRTENLLGNPVIWTNITANLPVNGTPSDLECHPYDANIVYMVLNKKVYKSVNKGGTWVNISGSLPAVDFNTIVFDKTSHEGLYIGTDAGVYYKDADMADWVLYGSALPVSVEVSELEIYNDPRDRSASKLRASTYGRGAWQTTLAPAETLLPPTQLTATTDESSVELSWVPPFYEAHVLGYRIYRNGQLLDMINGLSYTDSNIEKDVTFTYKVCALYTGNIESAFTNDALATIISPVELPYNQTFEKGTAGFTSKLSLEGWNYGTSESLLVPGREGHFFAANSYAAGEGVSVKDYLVTPTMDLSDYIDKTVTLKFAYTMRKYRTYDKFSVQYRVAPDSTWVKLVDMRPPSTFAWVWDTTQINLPSKALTKEAQIGFYYDNSNVFAWGAAIDDVELFVNTSGIENLGNNLSVQVYPNPNHGQFKVTWTSGITGNMDLQVVNLSGQIILEKNIANPSGTLAETIDLSTQPKGVYQLIIRSKSGEWKQKVTIQ